MYVLIVYDVHHKRVNKLCKFLRRYLHWIQNSVFEGELTKVQYFLVRSELRKLIKGEDSIIIFNLGKKWLSKEILGKEKNPISPIV